MKAPEAVIKRWVTDLLSTPIPMRTGSIDTWVTQLVVIPFHSSPWRDPTRANALGMRQVTWLTNSSVKVSLIALLGVGRTGYRRKDGRPSRGPSA